MAAVLLSLSENISSSGATMNSVEALREFINQRLTAAAGEIFTVFQQTIEQFEDEIYQQRRLLGINCKPQVKLHNAELQQHQDYREEQLFEQETNYCGEQEKPEPPHIKKEPEEPGFLQFKENQEEPGPSQFGEHEEVGTYSQEGEQFALKFESEAFREPSAEEQSDLSEAEEVPDTQQFLSHDSEVHDVKKHTDSESTINAELKEMSIFHSDRVENFPVSEKQAQYEKLLCKETTGKSVHIEHRLYQNLRTVTDKKKIICQICGKSYIQPSDLVRHMRSHTGEKPFSCEICGRSFSLRGNLGRHMRTHTGEKPYCCATCGKSFCRKKSLLCHVNVHNEMKP